MNKIHFLFTVVACQFTELSSINSATSPTEG